MGARHPANVNRSKSKSIVNERSNTAQPGDDDAQALKADCKYDEDDYDDDTDACATESLEHLKFGPPSGGFYFFGNVHLGRTHHNEFHRMFKTLQAVDVAHIECGASHIILRDADGHMWVAGFNDRGQCGIAYETYYEQGTYCMQQTHFSDQHIQIDRVFTSPQSRCTFWVSSASDSSSDDDHALFANGDNHNGKLGMAKHVSSAPTPQLMAGLCDVVQVACGGDHNIVLCASTKLLRMVSLLVAAWSSSLVSADVNLVIGNFVVDCIQHNKLFCAGNMRGGQCGHGLRYQEMAEYKWNVMETLVNVNIVSIACGESHSLFLAANGRVFACGFNADGQCGMEPEKEADDAEKDLETPRGSVGMDNNWRYKGAKRIMSPVAIPKFVSQGVVVTKIACGRDFSLCLDDGGNVYGFGRNTYGQLGMARNADNTKVDEPTLIAYFVENDVKVVDIKCGASHAYAQSGNGVDHYLWGANSHGTCLLTTSKPGSVCTPVNITVRLLCKEVLIKNVFLGSCMTFVTVTNCNKD